MSSCMSRTGITCFENHKFAKAGLLDIIAKLRKWKFSDNMFAVYSADNGWNFTLIGFCACGRKRYSIVPREWSRSTLTWKQAVMKACATPSSNSAVNDSSLHSPSAIVWNAITYFSRETTSLIKGDLTVLGHIPWAALECARKLPF